MTRYEKLIDRILRGASDADLVALFHRAVEIKPASHTMLTPDPRGGPADLHETPFETMCAVGG